MAKVGALSYLHEGLCSNLKVNTLRSLFLIGITRIIIRVN